MLDLINGFVEFLGSILSWQLFVFLAIVFSLVGLVSWDRERRAVRQISRGREKPALWPSIAALSGAVVVFFIISYIGWRHNSRMILATTAETVVKPCPKCKFDSSGHLVPNSIVGKAYKIPAHQMFVAETKLEPKIVDRIEVLPVFPAYSNNPRYGFDEQNKMLVVFSDVEPTNELRKPFRSWEPVLWAIVAGFAIFGGAHAYIRRNG